MRQDIKPGVFIGIAMAVLIIAAAVVVWVLRAPPPGAPVAGAGGADTRAMTNAAMKEAHGPTPDQMKQIQEWKKAHPDGYTKH